MRRRYFIPAIIALLFFGCQQAPDKNEETTTIIEQEEQGQAADTAVSEAPALSFSPEPDTPVTLTISATVEMELSEENTAEETGEKIIAPKKEEETPVEVASQTATTPEDTILDLITFFKAKPHVGEIADVLMNEAQLQALFSDRKSDKGGNIPFSIMLQMYFLDAYFSYDFTEAYKVIFEMTELRGLDLRAYRLDSIPKKIANLQNLEVLILSDNQLKLLPEEICQLKKLRYLDLRENQLVALPACLGELTNLEILYASHNEKLDQLPTGLKDLTQLKKLDLSRTAIGKNPDNLSLMCYLTALEELRISHTQTKQLPECIRNLNKLKSLTFSDNDMTELPSWISSMTQLEHLGFDQRGLNYDAAFQQIAPLKKVTKLYLIGTDIDSLPESIALLQHLESVNFFDANITYVPDTFYSLPKVTFVNFAYNPLKKVSPAISNFAAIEQISFHGCQLDNLPGSIKNIPTLKRLKVGDNYFSDAYLDSLQAMLPGVAITLR